MVKEAVNKGIIVMHKNDPRTSLRLVEIVPSPVWEESSIPVGKGYFHRWGEQLVHVTDGVSKLYGAAEVVGIVEAESGQVYEVPASRIRFLAVTIEKVLDNP